MITAAKSWSFQTDTSSLFCLKVGSFTAGLRKKGIVLGKELLYPPRWWLEWPSPLQRRLEELVSGCLKTDL